MSEQLTLADELRRVQQAGCQHCRGAGCPRCDPDYEEKDGDRATGIVTTGPVPYGVIPY